MRRLLPRRPQGPGRAELKYLAACEDLGISELRLRGGQGRSLCEQQPQVVTVGSRGPELHKMENAGPACPPAHDDEASQRRSAAWGKLQIEARA